MLDALTQKITRRKIQIALGCLWLLDGILQLQHQMFTRNFATQVLQPASQGQPTYVASPMHFVIQIILHQPALFDACFAIIQIGLGILILRKQTTRYGLLASVVWGLLVWYLGEGLGGLATGQALLLTGAPGAALLYAIIAVGVLPRKTEDSSPADWLAYVWMVLWMSGVLLLVWSQMTPKDLSVMIASMTTSAPAWLTTFNLHVSNWLASSGTWLTVVQGIVFMSIGLAAVISRRWRSIGITIGCLLALLFWVVGQNLGTYYTGLATDPNTAPLIILLGIAVLGTKEIRLDIL